MVMSEMRTADPEVGGTAAPSQRSSTTITTATGSGSLMAPTGIGIDKKIRFGFQIHIYHLAFVEGRGGADPVRDLLGRTDGAIMRRYGMRVCVV